MKTNEYFFSWEEMGRSSVFSSTYTYGVCMYLGEVQSICLVENDLRMTDKRFLQTNMHALFVYYGH